MIRFRTLRSRARTTAWRTPKLRVGATMVLRRFVRETDGNMTMFGIMAVFIMLVYGGIGIDMIYAEVQRTRLQNTLDRAVLAAADLEQEIDPELVVRDYLSKMNLDDALDNVNINVQSGLNYRIVNADSHMVFNSNFLHVLGFDKLQSVGAATAEERISEIEISLVLDISGSMGTNSKIENLRAAATEFVDTALDEANQGLTTISIVPYNATVNLGPNLAQHYTLSSEHTYSNCAIFPTSAYASLGVSTTDTIQRLSHFDPYTLDEDTITAPDAWCPVGTYGSILAHSSDRDTLTQHIASLDAGGNTAIDLGMKWGVALLDPSARPAVTGLINDGHVVTQATGRPANYDEPSALKVLIVMTDGINTSQYDLAPEFIGGLSNIWIHDRGDSDPSNDRFSHLIEPATSTSGPVYFWPRHENNTNRAHYRNTPDGGQRARQMSHAEVFARWGTRAFGQKFFYTPYVDGRLSYNDYYNAYYAYTEIVSGRQADARLATLCAAARDADITVFTIGFELPATGQSAIRNCASSPTHYFPVEGLEISDAFRSIENAIDKLRLTQ